MRPRMASFRGAVWAAGVMLAAAFSPSALAHTELVETGTVAACAEGTTRTYSMGSWEPGSTEYVTPSAWVAAAVAYFDSHVQSPYHTKLTVTHSSAWSADHVTASHTYFGHRSSGGISSRCEAPPAGSCPAAGTVFGGGGYMTATGGPGLGETRCVSSGSSLCAIKGTGFGVMLRTSGAVVQRYKYTGATCTLGDGSPTGQPDGCATDTQGNSVCQEAEPGCGTFNGRRFCQGALPAEGTCQTSADGNTFCVTSGAGDPASPPAPNNGMPGQAATPTAEANNPGADGEPGTADDGPRTVIYNSSTTNNGSGAGDGNGDGEGACGGTGQPPCKIDETGTPTGPGDEFNDGALNGAWNDLTSELAGKDTVNTPNREPIPALWSDSACQSITVEFFGGASRQFPGTWCAQIDSLRLILGWAFSLFVYWLLARKVMDAL